MAEICGFRWQNAASCRSGRWLLRSECVCYSTPSHAADHRCICGRSHHLEKESESEVLDDHPGRPAHPSFPALSAILLRHDNIAQQDGIEGAAQLITETDLPLDVMIYVAAQRALRAQVLAVVDGGLAPSTVLLRSTWIDGFLAGAAWGRRQRDGV